MASRSEKICNEVRHLPFAERIRLVTEFEDDLYSDEGTVSPVEFDVACEEQEHQRADEVMKGEVKLMSRHDLTRRLDEVRKKHTA